MSLTWIWGYSHYMGTQTGNGWNQYGYGSSPLPWWRMRQEFFTSRKHLSAFHGRTPIMILFACIYIYTYIHFITPDSHMEPYIYIYIYLYIYVCMYIYTHTHRYISKLRYPKPLVSSTWPRLDFGLQNQCALTPRHIKSRMQQVCGVNRYSLTRLEKPSNHRNGCGNVA